MLSWFKPQLFYVPIRCDQFEVRELGERTGVRTFTPSRPFSTRRLLVGEFTVLEAELAQAIQSMRPYKWIKPRCVLLLHPLERIEGGLAEVERTVFRELAQSVGALRWAIVEEFSEPLNDASARQRLDALKQKALVG